MDSCHDADSPRSQRALIALFSLCVLVVLLLPFVLDENTRPVGANVERQHGRWLVTVLNDAGIAVRAGMHVGDVVVSMDGRPPRWRRRTDPGLYLDATGTWTVERSGRLLTLHPKRYAESSGSFATPYVLLAIALACWGTAAGVRFLRPRNGLAAQFYWLSLCIGPVLTLSFAADNDVPWATVLNMGFAALLPAQFMRFCLHLAWGGRATGRAALPVRGLALTGGCIGIGCMLSGVLGLPTFDVLLQGLLGVPALAFLGGIAVLVHAAVWPRSPLIRQQVIAVLLGTSAAMLPLTMLYLVPEAAGQPPLAQPELLVVSGMCFPLAVLYAILRHRLFDLRPAIRRTLIYAAMTLVLASCYALLLFWLDAIGFSQGGTHLPLLSLAFFAVVSMTFMPLREGIVRGIDRLIFRDRYDYAATLQRLGSALASIRPLDELLAGVVDTLTSAMNLRGAAILLRQAGSEFALRAANGDYREPAEAAVLVRVCCRWNADREAPDDGWWLPLASHGVEHGLLYLGAKRSGAEFSAGDRCLVETLASQAAVAIANALLVERLEVKVTELALLRDRLLRVQEEERRGIAQDLHDGPLQTMLDLVRQVDATLESLPSRHDEPRAFAARLRSVIARGQDAADELRTVCASLYPPELRHLGVAAALAQLAWDTSRDEPLIVRFATTGIAEGQRLPAPVEETLYRVAREALLNVLRHARARHAEIHLALTADGVTLTVRDVGRGFSVPASTTALVQDSHLGLAGMRARSERLGGSCHVTSRPGAGTTVQVHLPLSGPQVPEMSVERKGLPDELHPHPAGR